MTSKENKGTVILLQLQLILLEQKLSCKPFQVLSNINRSFFLHVSLSISSSVYSTFLPFISFLLYFLSLYSLLDFLGIQFIKLGTRASLKASQYSTFCSLGKKPKLKLYLFYIYIFYKMDSLQKLSCTMITILLTLWYSSIAKAEFWFTQLNKYFRH